MMILSLILFALVLTVIVFAAFRDLDGMDVVEPGTEADDANTIRVAI
ncbi:hypothetical protein [Rubricoccus marinus]|nr:hypothetical protein [Rubricoccus marinus]